MSQVPDLRLKDDTNKNQRLEGNSRLIDEKEKSINVSSHSQFAFQIVLFACLRFKKTSEKRIETAHCANVCNKKESQSFQWKIMHRRCVQDDSWQKTVDRKVPHDLLRSFWYTRPCDRIVSLKCNLHLLLHSYKRYTYRFKTNAWFMHVMIL